MTLKTQKDLEDAEADAVDEEDVDIYITLEEDLIGDEDPIGQTGFIIQYLVNVKEDVHPKDAVIQEQDLMIAYGQQIVIAVD